MLFDENANSS